MVTVVKKTAQRLIIKKCPLPSRCPPFFLTRYKYEYGRSLSISPFNLQSLLLSIITMHYQGSNPQTFSQKYATKQKIEFDLIRLYLKCRYLSSGQKKTFLVNFHTDIFYSCFDSLLIRVRIFPISRVGELSWLFLKTHTCVNLTQGIASEFYSSLDIIYGNGFFGSESLKLLF